MFCLETPGGGGYGEMLHDESARLNEPIQTDVEKLQIYQKGSLYHYKSIQESV